MDEVLKEPRTAIVRDACIKRFEYSFETAWKAAQAYLARAENLEMASPTAVARACFRAGTLSEAKTRELLRMIQDRNLTVHTYDEALADQICSRLPEHARVLRVWLDSIEGRLGELDRLL